MDRFIVFFVDFASLQNHNLKSNMDRFIGCLTVEKFGFYCV